MNKSLKTSKPSKMEFFQGLGRTFMLPVALLAFMGLLLGLGSAFTSPSMIEAIPLFGNKWLQIVFSFMSTLGGFAFSYLPALFAMAIPLGLARREKGVAAFSGFVAYVVMHLSISFYLSLSSTLADQEIMKEVGQSLVFGIQSLEMGVLGGILAGIITYYLHEKFYNVELPDSFAFFSGVRFVPIITSLTMGLIGLILPLIWPFFANIIQGMGHLIQKAGVFGPFLFGSGERLLLPFGLHHILVAMIRFTDAGGTAQVDGSTVSGALNIFYSQLNAGEIISPQATAFLSQGKMPTFMFGLPAAALAMYHTAIPANQSKVKGLLLSGVIACAVTGITEPIEFLFLFISPLLWIFHVVMTGAGFMLMSLLGVTIGNTDGGLLDFIVFGIMQGNYTKWWLVIIVGLIWAAIYYFVFKTVILKQNLATPGRTDAKFDEHTNYSKEELSTEGKIANFDVSELLAGLGGKDNIESLDNCVTRLRMVLKDGNLVNDEKLKQEGALGVIHLDDHNVQVVIGTKVATVRDRLEDYLA